LGSKPRTKGGRHAAKYREMRQKKKTKEGEEKEDVVRMYRWHAEQVNEETVTRNGKGKGQTARFVRRNSGIEPRWGAQKKVGKSGRSGKIELLGDEKKEKTCWENGRGIRQKKRQTPRYEGIASTRGG